MGDYRFSRLPAIGEEIFVTTGGSKAQQRRARKAALEAKKKRRRKIVLGVAGLIVVALIAFFVTRPEPEELAATETFSDMGGGHLSPGDPTPAYNSSPATSGPHAASPAVCGIYTEELPDVTVVHNLEHGTVVIQYQPDASEADQAALQEFARAKSTHILLAPRSDLPSPIVLTSWTRMLRLDALDLDTLEVFYDRWARLGPEVGVACPVGIDQSA